MSALCTGVVSPPCVPDVRGHHKGGNLYRQLTKGNNTDDMITQGHSVRLHPCEADCAGEAVLVSCGLLKQYNQAICNGNVA